MSVHTLSKVRVLANCVFDFDTSVFTIFNDMKPKWYFCRVSGFVTAAIPVYVNCHYVFFVFCNTFHSQFMTSQIFKEEKEAEMNLLTHHLQ